MIDVRTEALDDSMSVNAESVDLQKILTLSMPCFLSFSKLIL